MEFKIKDINDYDPNIINQRFKEFSNLLDNFDTFLYEEAYLMEAVANNNNFGDNMKDALKKNYDNTMSTTKTAFGAARKVAKSLGKFYRTLYDLVMKFIKFSASTIAFIMDIITSIPRNINRCLEKLGSLTDEVVAKVTGDIMLYITHKDIEGLYTSNFINYLLQFKIVTKKLNDDNIWQLTKKVLWNKQEVSNYQVIFGYKQAKKDKVVSNKMRGSETIEVNQGIIPTIEKLNTKLKRITFNKTKIDMSIPGNRSIYLKHPETNQQVIKIITQDQNGKTNTITYSYYMDAIQRLVTDLESIKKELSDLESIIGTKISDVAYQNFASIPEEAQRIIGKVTKYIASVTNITGNLIKYINIDIKTIENMVDAINNNQSNNIQNTTNHNTNKQEGEA